MSEFDKLKAKLLSRGALFEDPEFPASSRSLRSDGRVDRNIRWRRPQEIVRNPVFIEKESSRFDLDQGQLGDCWFISAVSSLACSNRKLLQRCVPHDQSFSQDYAGIFLFKFWSFDTWVEVFVDDRLPTIGGRLVYGRNIDEPNEFWVALLEKAYAKLYKRYENLDGGHVNDALVDLTGGISERIELKNNVKLPDNLFELMYRTLEMNSMCGSSINAKVRREVDLGNGLYTGHAYSINKMLQTKVRGRTVKLIRLRNPWGRKEWRGAWSDSSYEWTSISDTEKRDIGLVTRDDGEFWMEFGEWQRSFDAVSFCHLHPDALTAEVAQDMQKRNWEVTTVHDGWVKGFSAGGCGNSPYQDLFWTNPQVSIELSKSDDADKDRKVTTVISLMQKAEEMIFDDLYIGIMVYQLKYGRPVRLDGVKYGRSDLLLTAPPTRISNLREMTTRLTLIPGVYVIIPCTFYPNKESDFLLRIFTESEAQSGPIDVETEIVQPPSTVDKTEDLFTKHTKGDRQMDAAELQLALNDIFSEETSRGFELEVARCMLAMMDANGSGYLNYSEFRRMMAELEVWKRSFFKYDTNRSGNIDTYELSKLFNDLGFKLSRKLLSAIIKRYGGKQRRMYMEDFVLCCSRIVVLYERFKTHSSNGRMDRAELTLDEWLRETMLC